ncbi:MAG: leucine-rich repeat protein [Clostridia bacterium]|nr:leucine-rich repeat protein [Clostridia bacterium]
MNKVFKKVMASLLIVLMLFAFVPVMGLELVPQAAGSAVFSLNLSSETDNKVVLTVKLDSGSFAAVDFGVSYNSSKVKSCSNISASLPGGFAMTNPDTGLVSGASVDNVSAGTTIATYTFDKVPGKYVTKDDFSLKVTNCDAADTSKVSVSVKNNLPSVAANETTKPTTTKPTTTKPTTTKPTTTKPTTTKPTTTKPTTTKPTTTTTTKPTTTTTTTAATVTTSVTATNSASGNNSGACGASATWIFDETTGAILISGSGAMTDYVANEPEWITSYRADIKEATIRYGITHIGANSFRNCYNLETVHIASSVMTIGAGAFDGCHNLKNVYYEGSEEEFYAAFPQAESMFGNGNPQFIFNKNSAVVWDEFENLTTEAADEEETENEVKDAPKNTIIIVIVAAILLIGAVVIVVIVVANKKKNNQPKDEPEEQTWNQYNQYMDTLADQPENPVQEQVPEQKNVQNDDWDGIQF